MLVDFRIKNFRSYKDEQIFSMVASKDDKLIDENTFLPTVPGALRLNRSAIVYGANASGKSNLVHALAFIRSLAQDLTDGAPQKNQLLSPFLFDQHSSSLPSEFELTFIQDNIRYQYGFSVFPNRVHEEWLIAYPKGKAQTWFERTAAENIDEEHEWYFGPALKGQKNRLSDLTRSGSLFLRVAAEFDHKQIKKVYEWIVNELHIVNIPSSSSKTIRHTIDYIKRYPELKTQVQSLLQFADLGIVDFDLVETEIRVRDQFGFESPALIPLSGEQPLTIKFQHGQGTGGNGSGWLNINQESHGTRQFFGSIGYVLMSLHQGGILVIDELDTSLHPLLVEALVKIFHNPATNPRNAQLIFNTHDVTLLDLTLFRRDQIWFAEKDRNGETTLYSLLEYKPRNDEAILKGYLSGRYGAVPFIDPYAELPVNGS